MLTKGCDWKNCPNINLQWDSLEREKKKVLKQFS